MTNRTKRNIYKRLAEVKAQFSAIVKESKKVNGQYRYVSHDRLMTVARPLFEDAGIAVISSVVRGRHEGNFCELMLEVRLVNVDDPEDQIITTWLGGGADNSDKGAGKATSYAFKTALLKLLMLHSAESDNEATHTQRSSRRGTETPSDAVKELLSRLEIIQDSSDPAGGLKQASAEIKAFKASGEPGAGAAIDAFMAKCRELKLDPRAIAQ